MRRNLVLFVGVLGWQLCNVVFFNHQCGFNSSFQKWFWVSLRLVRVFRQQTHLKNESQNVRCFLLKFSTVCDLNFF